MMNNSTQRALAVAGVAGIALAGFTGLGAGDAAAGPNRVVHKKLVDGTPVTVTLTGERTSVHPAVTNVATSREVFVSGKVGVNVGGAAEGASIKVGYIVGCQVNFGASAGTSAGVDSSATTSSSASGGITLGPGQAVYTTVVNTTDSDGDGIYDFTFTGNRGGVSYGQERFGVDGCAGYAQAQAKVEVTVSTDSVLGVIVLYGKPFSIG
ncbi:MAG: MspA family porin [Gordonia sp. (in: high G+C Gram-positive bacteria)]